MKNSDSMLTAQVPKDLAHAARIEAARRNVSRSELVRLAVRQFLQAAAAPKVEAADGR